MTFQGCFPHAAGHTMGVFCARGFPRVPTKCQNALLLLIPKAGSVSAARTEFVRLAAPLGCWLRMVFLWNALSTVWGMPANWINPLLPTVWQFLQHGGVSGLRELCPCRAGAEGSRVRGYHWRKAWSMQRRKVSLEFHRAPEALKCSFCVSKSFLCLFKSHIYFSKREKILFSLWRFTGRLFIPDMPRAHLLPPPKLKPTFCWAFWNGFNTSHAPCCCVG